MKMSGKGHRLWKLGAASLPGLRWRGRKAMGFSSCGTFARRLSDRQLKPSSMSLGNAGREAPARPRALIYLDIYPKCDIYHDIDLKKDDPCRAPQNCFVMAGAKPCVCPWSTASRGPRFLFAAIRLPGTSSCRGGRTP